MKHRLPGSTTLRHAAVLLAVFAGMLTVDAVPARTEEDPLQWTNPIAPNRADPHVLLHTDGLSRPTRRTTNTAWENR